MATLYCDFEAGNDNYAGSSFALLASGTDGRISSSTFSSATASFPNDGSLINQYLSIYNGTIYAVYKITAWVSSTSLTIAIISGGTALANQSVDRQYYIGGRWKSLTNGATAVRIVPGDTVRIMGSPAPTSLGINGTWTSAAQAATKNISSSTNATPISVTCTGHGYSTGDTVVITGHTTNTNANGTWEITVTGANTFTLDGSSGNGTGTSSGSARLRNNTRVMLASELTKTIACTGPRSAWTAVSPNTTSLSTTTTKEHQSSDLITVATAFTTGKAAYYTLPSTLDLSGYQQVSFWLYSFTAALGAGQVELRLCSDTAGDTVVDTISVPAVPAGARWQVITIDKGAALGSSIASISLYINTDLSTTANYQICLNNIIACKASSADDALTLSSLIGKNTTGETWWGIQSINGKRVMLDQDTNITPFSTNLRGYYGTSETVTTYKREAIAIGPAASTSVPLQSYTEAGSAGNLITYSGGWDRTAMTTQTLETWVNGQNGNGYAFDLGQVYLASEKLAAVRCSIGFYLSSGSFSEHNIVAANHTTSSLGAVYLASAKVTKLTVGHGCANLNYGVLFGGSNSPVGSCTLTLEHALLSNSASAIFSGVQGVSEIKKGSGAGLIANNSPSGISPLGAKHLFKNLTFENNATSISAAIGGDGVVFDNCLFSDATEYSGSLFANEMVYSSNHDQIAGNNKIFNPHGLISSTTDQRHTASGISWKLQPTSISLSTTFPLAFSLAKVACAVNALVTIKAWMRRDNTGLTMRLVCKGGQIAGVTSDVTASMTAAANTWEELTITFTPTEVGVVEITAEAFGGTTYSGWVDDLTISQA